MRTMQCMELYQLRTFLAVADEANLTRAAERVHTSAPAVSAQVKALEEELGVTLFTRGARGMQLTEAGELLRSRIAGPLRQIGHAIYEVRSLPTETGGNVVFGMPPTMILLLAGPLARRVAERAPNINLRIVDGYSGHLLEWLRRDAFRAQLTELVKGEDPEFVAYILRLAQPAGLAAS